MQLSLLVLFALAFQSCLALDLVQNLRNAGLVCTVSASIISWLLWPQQRGIDSTFISTNIPRDENASLAGSVSYEQANDVSVRAKEHSNFIYSTINKTIFGAGEHLRFVNAEANETSTRAEEYVEFMDTKEYTTTVAEFSNSSTSPIDANDTNPGTTTTRSLPSLCATAIKTTIVISPEITKEQQLSVNRVPTNSRSISPRISGTASTVCFCLATVLLLITYQLFVYTTSLHDWLYAIFRNVLAKAICFAITVNGKLPPHIADAISSTVELCSGFISHLSEGFGHIFDRNNGISPETVLAACRELRKLDSPRYHQILKAKRLRSLRRKRCVNAKATYKRAAQEFKECHDHWHGIFEKGIADIRQQLCDYTRIEKLLNFTCVTCAEVEKSLATHVTKLSDLTKKLDTQMALLAVAISDSTGSLEDMKSLVKQIDKLLIESQSADSKVKCAEGVIKALYNVGERMQMAPFTDTLKSITKASEEAQRVIYNAESAIVAASFAQRNPSQLFESAIIAARDAQSPPLLPLQSRVPALDLQPSDESSTPQRQPSPAATVNSSPLNYVACPPSTLISIPQCPLSPSFTSLHLLSSIPLHTAQSPPISPSRSPSAELSAGEQAGQRLTTSPQACPPVELSAPRQTAECSMPSTLIGSPAESSGLSEIVERSPGPSFNSVLVEAPCKPRAAQFWPANPLAAISEQLLPSPQDNTLPLSTLKLPERESIIYAQRIFAPTRPFTSVKDNVKFPAPAQPNVESTSKAPCALTSTPVSDNWNGKSISGALPKPMPASAPAELNAMDEAPSASTVFPLYLSSSLFPPAPFEASDERISETHCEPTPTPTDTTMEGAIPPSVSAEPGDESMTDGPPDLTPAFAPPSATMEDAIPTSGLTEPRDESMANGPPNSTPAFTPPSATMEDAISTSGLAEPRDESMTDVPNSPSPSSTITTLKDATRGKDWLNCFGQLPEAQQRIKSAKPFHAPLTIPKGPLVFSSQIQQLRGFKPKVPTRRWNSPKRGILQNLAPRATSTGIKAPFSNPPPTSAFEIEAPIAPAHAPPMVSTIIISTTSAPLYPTTSEPVLPAIAPQSKRINQTVFDQIQLSGWRRIKKPVPRLSKRTPAKLAHGSIPGNQPQGTPVVALDAASGGTPVDDDSFPEYYGDSAFDGFFAKTEGYNYPTDPAHNADFAKSEYPSYPGVLGFNYTAACSAYPAYSGDDDEAYSTSNTVYPVGTEEVIGPVDDYQIDVAGLGNYDFMSGNGLPASDAQPDDVSRLLDTDTDDAGYVDDCLLAERDGDDGGGVDYNSDAYGSDDYDSDAYSSDTNGYGSYGDMSDYDSDES